jgi:hypothetical protein
MQLCANSYSVIEVRGSNPRTETAPFRLPSFQGWLNENQLRLGGYSLCTVIGWRVMCRAAISSKNCICHSARGLLIAMRFVHTAR